MKKPDDEKYKIDDDDVNILFNEGEISTVEICSECSDSFSQSDNDCTEETFNVQVTHTIHLFQEIKSLHSKRIKLSFHKETLLQFIFYLKTQYLQDLHIVK